MVPLTQVSIPVAPHQSREHESCHASLLAGSRDKAGKSPSSGKRSALKAPGIVSQSGHGSKDDVRSSQSRREERAAVGAEKVSERASSHITGPSAIGKAASTPAPATRSENDDSG